MKKILIKSLIISGIINVVGCLVNFLCAKIWDFLLIYVHLSGGEYQGYVGFGILLEHIYPMTDGSSPGKVIHLSFDILNFLLYFAGIFIVVFAIIYFINKRKEKNKDKKEDDDDQIDYYVLN